jgi:hypothetical protein
VPSWLGGGAVVVATGLWAVVTFLLPDHSSAEPTASTVACVQQGGVAAGRDANQNTVIMTNPVGAPPAGSGASLACADTK